jgi:D-beta-D-heptose 7-phosphate kinase/D-beta-D-heptose 1-phosphate adenosyltransferase
MKIIVNGTFDILHLGHLNLLQYARGFPESFVYVLIDSDRRVRELKGKNRPVNTDYERASLLHALRYVDRVDIFDTDQELTDYIKNYEPDIMVKGSDYIGRPIIGAEYCKDIRYYGRLEKYSTTNTIQRIANR